MTLSRPRIRPPLSHQSPLRASLIKFGRPQKRGRAEYSPRRKWPGRVRSFKVEGQYRYVSRSNPSSTTDAQPTHPISFFPALLVVLNPLIVTVYRYAIAGKRIVSDLARWAPS
jgi:hypothetical protein